MALDFLEQISEFAWEFLALIFNSIYEYLEGEGFLKVFSLIFDFQHLMSWITLHANRPHHSGIYQIKISNLTQNEFDQLFVKI